MSISNEFPQDGKKTLLPRLLLLALMALLVSSTVFARPSEPEIAAAVWLQGPAGDITVGDEFVVSIEVSDVVDLFGAQVELSFTTADLQVVDADSGTGGIQITPGDCPVPDFEVSNSANNGGGSIEYAVTSLAPTLPVSGNCTLAEIRFEAQQAVASSDIRIEKLILADPDGIEIPASSTDLTIDILPNTSIAAVSLQGPAGDIIVGDEFVVSIEVSDVVDLFGAQVELSFTTADLQVVDADAGTGGIQITPGDCPVPDFEASNSADNSGGSIEYAVTSLAPTLPISGNCTMAEIRFEAQQAVTGSDIRFEELLLSDQDGIEIPATTTDLSVTILETALVADFSGTPTSGLAPLTVEFTNLSTGDITTCQWDFGDGGTSNDCDDPSHVYSDPDFFTVTLLVSGPGGSASETKESYIIVDLEEEGEYLIFLPVIIKN